jgi:hypothetical protein
MIASYTAPHSDRDSAPNKLTIREPGHQLDEVLELAIRFAATISWY